MARTRKARVAKKEALLAGSLLIAGALMFYSASVESPLTLAPAAPGILASAAVGMSAGVAPNEYNTLAAQLSAKEQDLNTREANLSNSSQARENGTRALAAASFVTSLILLMLVAMNFYFDWRRSRPLIA